MPLAPHVASIGAYGRCNAKLYAHTVVERMALDFGALVGKSTAMRLGPKGILVDADTAIFEQLPHHEYSPAEGTAGM